MNRSCGQEGISGASLRPEGSAPTLKPLPLAGAPVSESSRRENSLLLGTVPTATTSHPQRCRPPVSTCLFFSNPCFLSKLLSMGLKLPVQLGESLALLCAGGLLRTQQVHRAVETIITKLNKAHP